MGLNAKSMWNTSLIDEVIKVNDKAEEINETSKDIDVWKEMSDKIGEQFPLYLIVGMFLFLLSDWECFSDKISESGNLEPDV